MTMPPDAVADVPESSEDRVDFATTIARLSGYLRALPPGPLAELRRLNPDTPGRQAFLHALVRFRPDTLSRGNADEFARWGLIIHGMALMTPPGRPSGMPHDRGTPTGTALQQIDCSEARLARLLAARRGQFRSLLIRTCRHLASARQGCDWIELADLILAEGRDERRAERRRLAIARRYYTAPDRQSGRPAEKETNA